MCISQTRKTWKLSQAAKKRALELSLQGLSVKAVAAQISEEVGQSVSFQAIWQLRARNAGKLQIALEEEMDRAVALSPLATLENRLLELESVISLAFKGREWLFEQMKKQELASQERKECIRALQKTFAALPIVLKAIKAADDAVFRIKKLEVSLKHQTSKKLGADRSEVEQAILRVQKRGISPL